MSISRYVYLLLCCMGHPVAISRLTPHAHVLHFYVPTRLLHKVEPKQHILSTLFPSLFVCEVHRFEALHT